MPRARTFWILACVSLALGSTLVACSPEIDSTLGPEEQRLVTEALELITIRIESARDAQEAERLRSALPTVYTDEELSALLERLSQDSGRGHLLMAAIHESLQAMRPRLFPAEGPPVDANPGRLRTSEDP